MLNNKYKEILMGLLLLITSALYSHGDLPIRIKEKTQEISKDSTDPKLHFERGFLYQQHFEFNKAKCDYLRSKDLGNTDNLLNYRIAEVNFSLTDYSSALGFVNQYINIDSLDVKPHKLKAQILIKLNKQSEALEFYDFVIKNTLDIRPEDIVEYSTIFLLIDSTNYAGSINAIDIGLNKLGNHIISLRLAKIDYLKRSNQPEIVIEQYNDLITENTRKEFWYYRKANYLFDIDRLSESDIALQLAKISIEKLKPKIKNTSAIKNLIIQINTMEKNINHEV
jgi:hypothetical protein